MDPREFELPEREFVRALYRKLLARFEDERGFRYYLKVLHRGIRREALVKEFLNSSEYRSRPRMYLYDLAADPGENHPRPVGNDLLNLVEGYSYLQEILALEAQAVVSEPIFGEQKRSVSQMFTGKSLPSDRVLLFKGLTEKEDRSIAVIRRAFALFGEDVGIAFTGGKDSTVLLHLVRRAFDGRVPFKVIHIDTTVKFPEVYAFRDRLKTEWNLDLRVFRNEEALKWIQIAQNREECCHQLKTEPLKDAIRTLGLKALLTGVRWDEQAARAQEEYFSERQDPPHTRVHPLLHFTEQDVWEYIRKYDIPYCSLYDKGYRSLGCQPCTKPAVTGGAERAGRAQDKEQVMQRLRQLGYF
ncbi:MAG: phosphoadenosine phosphosulfate reductase family protein [Bacillota bacterium]